MVRIQGAGEKVIDGVVRQVEQSQPDTFILGLRLLIATVPFVLLATALLVAWRYPLTASVHERLNRILAARRAGKEDADEQRAEAAQLTMLLIGPRET